MRKVGILLLAELIDAAHILNTLCTKKKLGFVDGTIHKPRDASSELKDLWMVKSILVAWIFNIIESSICSTVTYMEIVQDLCEDLRQRFSIGNGPRFHSLKSNLAACKQQGQSVVVYYG